MKFLKPFILILPLVLMTSFAKAQAADCFDKKQADKIRQDFKFSGNIKVDLCDPNNSLTQAFKALTVLSSLELTEAPKGLFTQNILNEAPYKYFKRRVSKIVFEYSCPDVYFAYIQDNETQIMHVCPNFTQGSLLTQVSAMVHEARHLDDDRYSHVKCDRGQFRYSQERYCDPSYPYKGSYAIQADFHQRLAKNKSLHPALLQESRSTLLGLLTQRFNRLPGDLKDGAYLTNSDHVVSFFDGTSNQKVRTLSPGEIQYISPFTSETILKREGMLALATSLNYYCGLYQKGLACSDMQSEKKKNILFSKVVPLSLFARNDKNGTSISLAFTDNAGRIAILPETFQELSKMEESDFKFRPNTGNILKAQSWQDNSKDIVITQDQRLFFLKDKAWTPLLPQQKFINVIAPAVWSPSLEAL